VQAYPDRLFGFAGIDPTQGLDAIHEIERAITQMVLGHYGEG
jgi:predicted TIM-barrel fold metal-dependent hydrolase